MSVKTNVRSCSNEQDHPPPSFFLSFLRPDHSPVRLQSAKWNLISLVAPPSAKSRMPLSASSDILSLPDAVAFAETARDRRLDAQIIQCPSHVMIRDGRGVPLLMDAFDSTLVSNFQASSYLDLHLVTFEQAFSS